MAAQSPQSLLIFFTGYKPNLLGYCIETVTRPRRGLTADSPPGRPEERDFISKIWYLISILQHQIGNKQYELSNHLGNVQATVTDNRTFGIVEGDSVKTYKPVIAAAYDYYPFGMLMPDRYVSDTTAKCVTVTQSKWVTKKVLQCYNVTNWIWPGYIQWSSGKATPVQLPSDPDNAGILIEVNATSGVQFEFEVAADADNEFQLETAEFSGSAATVSCFELIGGQQVSLGSFALAQSYQTIKVSIKPTTTKIYTSITGGTTGTAVKIKQLCKWVPVMVQETILVDVCDGDKDRYRFGFNGQEKVNEWAGIGNFMDYKARGQDTRIGRFLSRDPLATKFPMLSPYQFASNTPIWAVDLDGKEGVVSHVTQWTTSSGEVVTNVVDEYNTLSYAKQYGTEGALTIFTDLDKGTSSEIFYPEYVVTGVKLDTRSFLERGDSYFNNLGNGAGREFKNSSLGRGFAWFDHQMKTADEVGFRFKFAYEDGSNSLKASIGIRSTTEDNFGFEGKAGFERKGGLSTKANGIGVKTQLGFYWKHSDNSIKFSQGSLSSKIRTSGKFSLGPLSVETSDDGTDELSITLGRKSLNSTKASIEVGAKSTTEYKFQSKMYNLK